MSVDGPKDFEDSTIKATVSSQPITEHTPGDSKIKDIAASSITETSKITPEPIAIAKPISKLSDFLSDLDLEQLVKDGLGDKETYYRVSDSELFSKCDFAKDYLTFIAMQRQSLGDAYTDEKMAEKLKDMPLDIGACKIINISSDFLPSIEIKFEDLKIFTQLMSKIYKEFNIGCDDLFKQIILEDMPKDEKILRNFFIFNGLYQRDSSLIGHNPIYTYLEIAKVINSCGDICDEDKAEFSSALNSATDLTQINEGMIDKIKEGKLVVIRSGYRSLNSTHEVSIMFYKNEFVICNRGSRITGTPIVQRFTYDQSKIDLDVLKYIAINRFLMVDPDVDSGMVAQHLNTEVIFPKMLDAKRINKAESHLLDTYDITFKDQKVGNCAKASPLTAVKMAIYLKLIKEGKLPKEASLTAKKIGNKISNILRRNSIEEARKLLKFNPGNIYLSQDIKKAEDKLYKEANIIINNELLNIGEILKPRSECQKRILKHRPGYYLTREATESDHPLLLAIAKQRVMLGESFSPNDLKSIPLIDNKKCKQYFEEELGGLTLGDGSILKITNEDCKIFICIIKQILRMSGTNFCLISLEDRKKLIDLNIKDFQHSKILSDKKDTANVIILEERFLSYINNELQKLNRLDLSRDATKKDHPLLLAIAKQRAILGEDFLITDLNQIPLINYEKCEEYFEEELGGVILTDGSTLKISAQDEIIFWNIVKKILDCSKHNPDLEITLKDKEIFTQLMVNNTIFNSFILNKISFYLKNTFDILKREATEADHPLLLAIAKQRAILGKEFKSADLKEIPLINLKKCKQYFEEELGGLTLSDGSTLKITAYDWVILRIIIDQLLKEISNPDLGITPEDIEIFKRLEFELESVGLPKGEI